MSWEDGDAPDGWTQTTLGALGKYLNGRAFKTSEWAKTGRPIIRIQDLTGSNRNPNYFEGEVDERYVVRPGDLLISWSATLGAYIWDGPEAVLNQHIFKVDSSINKRFHYHLVRERIAELGQSAHGSGMVHVTKGAFDETPVAIPNDRQLQERIANLIDNADAASASASDHIRAARQAIERFKQSVLAAACSGRLTEEWRESTASGTGSEHKKSLAALREQAWSGSHGVRRYLQPVPIDTDSLPQTPDSWTWVSADAACVQITDGEHIQPPYQAEGFPMLSAKHVRDGFIDPRGAGLIAEPALRKALQRCAPKEGDILVVSVGATTGRSAIVEGSDPFAIVRSVLLLRPLNSSRYLLRWLQSAWAFQWMVHASGASAQPHLYIRDIKRLPIPIPPPDEQDEIVRRIDQLLSLANSVSKRVERAERELDRTARAVLAKTFRGELVS